MPCPESARGFHPPQICLWIHSPFPNGPSVDLPLNLPWIGTFPPFAVGSHLGQHLDSVLHLLLDLR